MTDESLFIYKIQPVRPEMLSLGSTPDEARIVGEHFDYLQRLTEQGVVSLAGRTLTTDYGSFGIIIFTAESEEAARRIVREDPAVRQRIMRAELYPFRIGLLGELSSILNHRPAGSRACSRLEATTRNRHDKRHQRSEHEHYHISS